MSLLDCNLGDGIEFYVNKIGEELPYKLTLNVMKLTNYNPEETNYSSYNALLDKFIQNSVSSPKRHFTPAVDILEGQEMYEIHLALPGMNKENFHIDLNENKLTISGERKVEENKEGRVYLSIETQFGRFSRTFYLPEDVDSDKIEAKYEDGLLKMQLPKFGRFTKKIQIKIK